MKILLILSIMFLLFSCGSDNEEAINYLDEFNDKMPGEDYTYFARYTDYLTIPDFLTEQQADLYKKAAILHYIFNSPQQIDSIPRIDAAENGSLEIGVQFINGREYRRSTGRYRNYADFEELMLSVFTRDFFEHLNRNGQFIETDGRLYMSTESRAAQMSLFYAPWQKPDEAALISASDSEIRFNVTGFYFEELTESYEGYGSITSLTVEIVLTRIEGASPVGWRFSQFATAGNPYTIDE